MVTILGADMEKKETCGAAAAIARASDVLPHPRAVEHDAGDGASAKRAHFGSACERPHYGLRVFEL